MVFGFTIKKSSDFSSMQNELNEIKKNLANKNLRPSIDLGYGGYGIGAGTRGSGYGTYAGYVPNYSIKNNYFEDLAIRSDIFMTSINALRNKIFRRGYKIKAIKDMPDQNQLIKLRSILKRINENKQSLKEVSKIFEQDENIFDDGYLIAMKDYIFGANGEIVNFDTKEIIRANPKVMSIITDSEGRLGHNLEGKRVYISPTERSVLIEEHKAQAMDFKDENGLQLQLACYRGISFYNEDAQDIFYFKDEVVHASKHNPSSIYGMSPIHSIWMKIITLIEQDRYLLLNYQKGRPPRGMLVVPTTNFASTQKAWESLKAEARKDPHGINPFLYDSRDSSQKIEWIEFMKPLGDMQFIETRNEMRRAIGGRYGVMPLFSGDMAQSGGLNNESLMPDIPVMIKKHGWIDFVPISSLHKNGDHTTSEFGLKNLQVLTRSGWSPIKRAFRHKCKDREIYEINTTTGYTEVTGDHSLFKENKEELFGKDIKVGEKLEIKKIEQDNYCPGITKEFAYTLGLFAADGSSDKNQEGSRVTIYNTDKELLNKAKFGADGFFAENFNICDYKNTNGNDISKLNMDKNKVMSWIDEYCYSTYSERMDWSKDGMKEFRIKKVPQQIINGDNEIKKSYLEGYMDGDGHVDKKGGESFSTISKTLCAGLQFIYNSLGKKTKIEWKENGKSNILRARIVKTDFKTKENEVVKVTTKRYTGNVYDIETEDHTFVAGVGYLLHHNSLQITVTNQAVEEGQKLYNEKILPWILRQFKITDYSLNLEEPEEKDEVIDAKLMGIKIDNAVKMSQMGFDVEYDKESDEFNFSEEAINPVTENLFGGPNQTSLEGLDKIDMQADQQTQKEIKKKVDKLIKLDKQELIKEGILFDLKKQSLSEFISKALFERTFEGLTKQKSDQIKKLLLTGALQKDSLTKMINQVVKLGVDKEQAELITRTEESVLKNSIREFNFKKAENFDTMKFSWFGPKDKRTSDISKELVKKSAKGLPLEELKTLVRKTSEKFGFKPDRDWYTHPNMRHIYRRKL